MNERRRGPAGMGGRAARGIWTTVLGQSVAIATQLLSVVILARLLVPEDYGLLVMVMAIVVIGEVVRDFGLSNAAIQAPVLSNAQRSNLFWWNATIGVACALALFLCAPLLADYYDEPRVEQIAQVLSVTFIMSGLATQARANLARDMRFGALAFTDVIPGVVGLLVAIYLANTEFGVWALVAQRITIAVALLVIAVSLDRWLPGLPRRGAKMGALLRYGANTVGAQLISVTGRNFDYIVIGYRFGTEVTGLYSRAFELVINTLNQINAPSTKVAVPILSRLQHDEHLHTRYLLFGQRALLFVIVPILGIGFALAAPLVEIALGPRWSGVVPFVYALAIVAAADRILGYATWWFALSKGRTDVTLKVTVVRSVVVVSGILAGSAWGPLGVAWGYALGAIVGWLADLYMYRKLAGAPSGRLLANAALVVSMNVLPIALARLSSSALIESGAALQFGVGILVYALSWSVLVLSIPPFRKASMEFVGLARRILRP